MKRNIIVLAAHDDGSGAHVIMRHICKGIIDYSRKFNHNPLIIYLNSSSFNKKELNGRMQWATDLWCSVSSKDRWELIENNPDRLPDDKFLEDKDGIWMCVDNVFKFKKNKDGTLDAKGTRELLSELPISFKNWAFQIRAIDKVKKNVKMTIEMGVPQLSEWAMSNNNSQHMSAIAVGDMLWSHTLTGSLAGAGEYDEEVRDIIEQIEDRERYSSEFSILPIIAPYSYREFLSHKRIPTLSIPGFFGKKEDGYNLPDDDIHHIESEYMNEMAKRNIDISNKPIIQYTEKDGKSKVSKINIRNYLKDCKYLVVLSSGMTEVWKGIYKNLQDYLKTNPNSNFALLSPHVSDNKSLNSWYTLIDNGYEYNIPPVANQIPYFCEADLGITRGGVTIIDFFTCNLPFIIVQEPNHWLSQIQQAQAKDAGLCHTASLSHFQDPVRTTSLIEDLLTANNLVKNELMRKRMTFLQFGIEDAWAEYVMKTYYEKV